MKKTVPQRKVIAILLKNMKESLRVADEINQKQISQLWVIVCSYYAMFYVANAVLLRNSYKVGEKIAHKVTADALIVYVRNKLKASLLEDYEKAKEQALVGIKADELIKSFDHERNKRSFFQYNTPEAICKQRQRHHWNGQKFLRWKWRSCWLRLIGGFRV